jgi:hypothetical protein
MNGESWTAPSPEPIIAYLVLALHRLVIWQPASRSLHPTLPSLNTSHVSGRFRRRPFPCLTSFWGIAIMRANIQQPSALIGTSSGLRW